MTPHQFWYEEEELLEVYIKAYFERTRYEAWINGQYAYLAQTIVISNALGGDKAEKESYPDYESITRTKNQNQDETLKPKSINDNQFLSQFY